MKNENGKISIGGFFIGFAIALVFVVIVYLVMEVNDLKTQNEQYALTEQNAMQTDGVKSEAENEDKSINENKDENEIVALENIEESTIKKCNQYLNCITNYGGVITFNNIDELSDREISWALYILLFNLYEENNEEFLSMVSRKANDYDYYITKDKINELAYEVFGKRIMNFDSGFKEKDNMLLIGFAYGDARQYPDNIVYTIKDNKIIVDYSTYYLGAGTVASQKTEYYEAIFSRDGDNIQFVSNKKLSNNEAINILVYDIGKENYQLEEPVESVINVPYINIKSDEADRINKEIQDKYMDMELQNEKYINNVSYEVYVNGNVLSLIINERNLDLETHEDNDNQKVYNLDISNK